jgi:hypothetical protein
MQNQGAALKANENVFRAPVDAQDDLIAQRSFESGRDRPAQPAVTDNDINDAGSDERGRNAAPRGFYFRELGQRRRALSRAT